MGSPRPSRFLHCAWTVFTFSVNRLQHLKIKKLHISYPGI